VWVCVCCDCEWETERGTKCKSWVTQLSYLQTDRMLKSYKVRGRNRTLLRRSTMPNTNTVFVTTLAVTLLARISQCRENILHEYEISRSVKHVRGLQRHRDKFISSTYCLRPTISWQEVFLPDLTKTWPILQPVLIHWARKFLRFWQLTTDYLRHPDRLVETNFRATFLVTFQSSNTTTTSRRLTWKVNNTGSLQTPGKKWHIYDTVKTSSVISDIETKSFYQRDPTRKAIYKNVSTNGQNTPVWVHKDLQLIHQSS